MSETRALQSVEIFLSGHWRMWVESSLCEKTTNNIELLCVIISMKKKVYINKMKQIYYKINMVVRVDTSRAGPLSCLLQAADNSSFRRLMCFLWELISSVSPLRWLCTARRESANALTKAWAASISPFGLQSGIRVLEVNTLDISWWMASERH